MQELPKMVWSWKWKKRISILYFNVNLKGTFNTIRHSARQMLKQRSGKIINISSVSGILGNVGQANYAASKAGVIGLTKTMARELGSRGITVNAIAPGFVDTEMTEVLSEEIRENACKQIILGRFRKTGGYCKYSGISGIRQSRLYYRTGHQRRWRYERINKENKWEEL